MEKRLSQYAHFLFSTPAACEVERFRPVEVEVGVEAEGGPGIREDSACNSVVGNSILHSAARLMLELEILWCASKQSHRLSGPYQGHQDD